MKTVLIFLTFSLSINFLSAQNKPSPIPDWVNKAVFYEIYPQSFNDTNGDGIGDLRGIINKLDYVKSLGVTAIWLNPFYESPFRDAGYDVSDYYKVSSRYGNINDVKELFDKAHKLGLRVIIDFVPGHTSIDHPWFKESAKVEKNKYSNWYIWTNSTWNDGGADKGRGMINGYSERDANYMINFFWHQPALNFGFGLPDSTQKWQLPTNHPDILALREEMKKILRYWLDLGSDGFRVDMAGSIIRKDVNGEGFKFWQEVKQMLSNDYPNAFMVSEWSSPIDAIKAGFTADFLHWIPEYNNLFRKEASRIADLISADGNSWFDMKGKGDIEAFMKAYQIQYDGVKGKGFISLPVGNHDLSRINVDRTNEELELIYVFQMCMPGVPFIYYGDEIGMKQLYGRPSKEGCYPPRSGARTPMQWSNMKNSGFSEAKTSALWLSPDTTSNAPNVREQEKNINSLLNKTKRIIDMRNNHLALEADADFNILYVEKNKYPFVFLRQKGGEKLLIALNPSGQNVEIELPIKLKGSTVLLSNNKISQVHSKLGSKLIMKGVSYAIFKVLQ